MVTVLVRDLVIVVTSLVVATESGNVQVTIPPGVGEGQQFLVQKGRPV